MHRRYSARPTVFGMRALSMNPPLRGFSTNTDPDDNKFVDCAICGGAELIVSNDKHFDVLKAIDFPYVKVMRLQEFCEK